MNARARSWWLLPCVLSACAAETQNPTDAAVMDARSRDGSFVAPDAATGDVDSGSEWPAPTYEPTFGAIFDEVFQPQHCASVFCHGIGGATLDFSSKQAAYASLINEPPTGAMCRDRGLILVVPNDPDASLLMSKVESDTPACGERMPRLPGIVLDARQIAQMRAWIERGAPND